MSQEAKKPNWFKKHKILTVIIAIIVLGAAAGAGSGSKSDNANSDSSNTNGTPTQKIADKTEFAVGETIDIDSRQLTVTNIERDYQTGNQFAHAESGNEFVLVTVNIQNNSKSDLMYSTFNFQLQDSNGVKHNEAIMALTEGRLNTGTLASGGKITGKLAYEVPKGDSGLKLVFESGSLFGKTVTVKF